MPQAGELIQRQQDPLVPAAVIGPLADVVQHLRYHDVAKQTVKLLLFVRHHQKDVGRLQIRGGQIRLVCTGWAAQNTLYLAVIGKELDVFIQCGLGPGDVLFILLRQRLDIAHSPLVFLCGDQLKQAPWGRW